MNTELHCKVYCGPGSCVQESSQEMEVLSIFLRLGDLTAIITKMVVIMLEGKVMK